MPLSTASTSKNGYSRCRIRSTGPQRRDTVQRARSPRTACGTVKVESIGGTLMVQHYHAVGAGPTRVEMLSKRSRGYVMHLIPVHFLVRWTMAAASRTTDTTTFDCTVEIEMPTLVRFAARLTGAPYFVRKHVKAEAPNFAADIERKLRARVSSI